MTTTFNNAAELFSAKHTSGSGLNWQDAEELETLKVLSDTAADEYEALLDQSKELTLKIAAKRIDYLKKLRDYQSLAKAMAGMAGGAA